MADTETTQLLKRIADHLSDLVTTIAAKDCKEGDSIKPMPFLKMEERIDRLLASKPIPDRKRIQLTDARFAIKRLFVRHGAKLNMVAIKNPCVTGAFRYQRRSAIKAG